MSKSRTSGEQLPQPPVWGKLETVVEENNNLVAFIDRDFRISFFNGVFPPLDTRDVTGKPVFDFLEEKFHSPARQTLQTVFKTGQTARFEIPLTWNDTEIWYAIRLGPVRRNRTIDQLVVVAEDISRRKHEEVSLRTSEELYRLLADSATDLITRQNDSGVITYASPASLTILGYPHEELEGLRLSNLIYPEDYQKFKSSYSRLARKGGNETITFRIFHKSGHTIWMETSLRSVNPPSGELYETVAVSRDITERMMVEEALREHRKRLEELVTERTRKLENINRILEEEIKERIITELELKESRETLRRLSAHQESTREEERTRIAREIHDELGQLLSVLRMEIKRLEKTFESEDELRRGKTVSMTQLVDQTIQQVKRISRELRPSILDNLGFISALRWQVKEFQKRAGIQCQLRVKVPEDIPLTPHCASALFRICQEGLTNVLRHAEATRVTITIAESRSKLSLTIRDNGKGMVPENLESHGSFGLLGIRERVHFMKGTVSIDGVPRRGTKIDVKIPLIQGETIHDQSSDR
ncbi:MAG TPA: PAS domain S-box protein [Calditrichia bacterium]|nr:PAS domain S-box protein [Calditrichota bacterium]HQV30679.1 PAS domain S-box protein [Calditrichia bacterium]